MNEITIISAFFAGIVTFFAPCTFTALPGFLAYISAKSTQRLPDKSQDKKTTPQFRFDSKVFFSSLYYVLGFSLIFALLGLTATYFGSFLHQNSDLLARIGGITVAFFGVFLLFGDRIKPLAFLYRERRIEIKSDFLRNSPLLPFLLGLTNAFAWTPCIGPILGAVLFAAGATTTVLSEGAVLMLAYALGISLPFMIIALFFSYAAEIVRNLRRFSIILNKVSAGILIVIGLAFAFGFYDVLFNLLYNFFRDLGYTPA